MMYASRTGTRRNLDALRRYGWRLLISATGVHRSEGFPYAIDNGAWTAFQQGREFDSLAFRTLLESHGRGADWIVCPDVVADAVASLRMTERWLPEVSAVGARVLVAVQDGMAPDDVAPWVRGGCGVFLGGSTEWKLDRMQAWGDWCASEGAYYHVARVNTGRRIKMAQLSRAHSVDGTSATRFSVNIRRLSNCAAQTALDLFAEPNRTENQTRSDGSAATAPDSSTILEAGDRARTDDIQLGNVTAKGKS